MRCVRLKLIRFLVVGQFICKDWPLQLFDSKVQNLMGTIKVLGERTQRLRRQWPQFSQSQKGFYKNFIWSWIPPSMFPLVTSIHMKVGIKGRVLMRVKGEKMIRSFRSYIKGLFLFQRRSVIQLTFEHLCPWRNRGVHKQTGLST